MRVRKSGMLRNWWRRALHLGFRLLYNEMAWSYDVVSWLVSLGEWRRWQAAALPFVQGNRVLEIAHGPGHMLKALACDDRHVTGVDMSRAMGRLAARRIRGIERPVALVRSRAQVLPFRSGAFDTVFCTFPTYFIAEKETMESICRVLKPGGRYLIVPEGRLTGNGPVERLIAWLFTITGQRDDMFSVNEDAHWPADSPRWRAFRRKMERAGFTMSVHHAALARSSATVIIATRNAP
jgi:ubiquinone/menaquinone biosynthesis C-methylase UbiE